MQVRTRLTKMYNYDIVLVLQFKALISESLKSSWESMTDQQL